MTQRFKRGAAALAWFAALAACGSAPAPAAPSSQRVATSRAVEPTQAHKNCLPGAHAACECDAHSIGTKACDMRGEAWSECSCAADAPDIKPSIRGGELSREFAATGLLISTQGLCTATLVTPDTILTAGHCLNSVLPSEASFVIGIDGQNAVRSVRLSKISVHPGFDLDSLATHGHDLAVGHLSETIDDVAPVVLYFGDARALAGKRVRLTGYGAESRDPNTKMTFGGGVRRSASISLGEIGPEALEYPIRSAGHCSGDSGGPLFFKLGDNSYVQVGVVSWADSACTTLGGVQRIDIYRDWLASVGVPTSQFVREVSCLEDHMCDGQCEVDPDCLALLCPQGSCTAPYGTCVADDRCDDACGSADPDCNRAEPEQDPCQAYGLNDNGACDPQCPNDSDCAPPEASCARTTVMPGPDGMCYYMSDQHTVCDSSPLQTLDYDPTSKHCLYFDATGTNCGYNEAISSLNDQGQCVYVDPSGRKCGRRWPFCVGPDCRC